MSYTALCDDFSRMLLPPSLPSVPVPDKAVPWMPQPFLRCQPLQTFLAAASIRLPCASCPPLCGSLRPTLSLATMALLIKIVRPGT